LLQITALILVLSDQAVGKILRSWQTELFWTISGCYFYCTAVIMEHSVEYSVCYEWIGSPTAICWTVAVCCFIDIITHIILCNV